MDKSNPMLQFKFSLFSYIQGRKRSNTKLQFNVNPIFHTYREIRDFRTPILGDKDPVNLIEGNILQA